MKRKVAGILFALLTLVVASSLVFADTAEETVEKRASGAGEVNFTARLNFESEMDNHVELELSNHGTSDMLISRQAHYIDEIGSAGSWDCRGPEDVPVGPGKSQRVRFEIAAPVSHGKNSILAFFFQYDGKWYLGKVGENNGVEYFLQHN